MSKILRFVRCVSLIFVEYCLLIKGVKGMEKVGAISQIFIDLLLRFLYVVEEFNGEAAFCKLL